MRTRSVVLLSLATLLAPANAALGAPVKRALTPTPAQWVPGEVVVQFASDVTPRDRQEVHAERGAAVKKRIKGFGFDVVRVARGVSVPEAVAAYRKDPAVVLAEPNYIRYADITPDDRLFSDLWGLENAASPHPVTGSSIERAGKANADIDAPVAWDTPSLVSPVVAVIDAGFNTRHEDLVGSLWTNPDEAATPEAGDVHGWDFGERDSSLASSFDPWSTRHGTHVVGTIAAGWDNGVGIAGICRTCKVMLLKVENGNGEMTIGAELAAIAYAERHGASVVNMSFGGAFWSAAERAAIKAAAERAAARGNSFLVVAAAGNESLDNDMYLGDDRTGDRLPDVFSPSYPASYTLSNIVSVAASNHRDEYAYGTECFVTTGSRRRCAFTNWGGDSVDLAAPGTDIYSTTLGSGERSGYLPFDGTSMAAPHVTGVAALLKSQDPTLTTADLKNKILNSVEPGALHGLASQLFSWRRGNFTLTNGRLDAGNAVAAPRRNAQPTSDGNIGGARSIERSRTNSVSWPGDVNDVYKRKLYVGRTYRIRLNGPTRRDFDLFLWQRFTKEIWQTNVGCPTYRCPRVSAGRSADETITFTPKRTGTYYIHVSAYLGSSGWYTLSVRRA